MLDHFKLISQVAKNASQITNKQDQNLTLAMQIWPQFALEIDFKTYLITPNSLSKIEYTIISCDGSQVYPDRHMGTNFYLINTGSVILRYSASSSVALATNPYFLTDIAQAVGSVADYVDSKRHELEMQDGLGAAKQELLNTTLPVIYLVDGSLIAWHLFAKSQQLCEMFLPKYLAQLNWALAQNIPVLGYISLPNSTDLINLLRAKLHDLDNQASEHLPGLVDIDLLEKVLPVGHFTNWFVSQVAAVQNYPEKLKIYFTYFNTGYEIARIEVPAYIFEQPDLLNLCMQVVVDQVAKGYGYPVVLSEAHQQAVIKTADRAFFYQLIQQFSGVTNKSNRISRKLRHKQLMHL